MARASARRLTSAGTSDTFHRVQLYGKTSASNFHVAQVAWQSRVGLGPRQKDVTGSPGGIRVFQDEHLAAIHEIEERCAAAVGGSPRDTTYEVRARGGGVECRVAGYKKRRFVDIGLVDDIADAARRRSRYYAPGDAPAESHRRARR